MQVGGALTAARTYLGAAVCWQVWTSAPGCGSVPQTCCRQRPTCCSQVAEDKDVMVIDSRCGEDFAAFSPGGANGGDPAIVPRFDACASWWTQVSGMHQLFYRMTVATSGAEHCTSRCQHRSSPP